MNKFSKREYRMHVEDSDGFCLSCGEIRYGLTEPDAEGYPCAECHEQTVCGFETALVNELIEIVGEVK